MIDHIHHNIFFYQLLFRIINLTKICDGVRCDMAMLALNNVFDNTWSGALNLGGYEKPQAEFWS